MHLSSAQWATIRKIAAEQAREIVNKEYVSKSMREGREMGLDSGQLAEISRIAQATARKHMNQIEFQATPVIYFAIPGAALLPCTEFIRYEGSRGPGKLRAEDIQRIKEQLGFTPTPVKPKEGDLKSADGGDYFTFFRGEWRTRSELKGFASASQYL